MMHALSSRIRLSIAIVAPVLSSSLAASAQITKISGELAHDPGGQGGDVSAPGFTPDGTRLLFEADKFYSVLADGSAIPVELFASDVSRYRVSPDSALVVFVDDEDRLWSRAVDGSTAKVALATAVDPASDFEITPDGTQVVFQDGGLSFVPIDGSEAPKIIATANSPHFIWPGEMSADGEWTIFVDAPGAVCGVSQRRQVYSVRLDGSEAPRLLSNFTGFGADVILLDPDGQRVVYAGRHICGTSAAAVYSVPVDGSAAAIQLSSTSSSPIFELGVSPDGTRVVYVAAPTSGIAELFSVPIDGSASETRLNPALGPGMDVGGIFDGSFQTTSFQISPDGTRVVYVADQRFDGVLELFSVPIAGGASTELAGGMVSGGDVLSFEAGPLSLGVVFRADKLVDGVDELFAVPFSGGAFRLNGALVAGGDVVDFRISTDDQHVVYRADRMTDEVIELYRVATTGGPNARLSDPLVAGGDVASSAAYLPSFVIDSDASRVAYLADQDVDDVRELYSVPMLGLQDPVKVNGPLPMGPVTGDVGDFEITADGGVVYLADGEVENVFELYRAPVGGGTVTKLSGPMVAGGGVDPNGQWELSPDGSRVLYLAEQETDGLLELFSVPVDASEPAIKLNHSIAPGIPGIQVFELSADGTRVIYRVELDPFSADLFAAAVDGSGTPVQLNLPGQSVDGLSFPPEHHITSDGTFVLYRTESELWRVRSDGSDSPVRLSDPMVARGMLFEGTGTSFQLSADGRYVAYLADARVDGRYELFLVAVDGIGADALPIRVNKPLATGGDVTRFAISPDGGRVVYRADQELDERHELYAYVGLALSAPPAEPAKVRRGTLVRVKLNRPLPSGGDVEEFVLGPDGSQVLFTAGAVNAHELFIAPTDGGTPAAAIAGAPDEFAFSPDGARVVFDLDAGLFSMPSDASSSPVALNASGCNVLDFAISPDSAWVSFLSRECGNNLTPDQFYARPIDGSSSSILVNGTLPPGGDVRAFGIAGDSSYAVYRADQDVNDIVELYSRPLPVLP